READARREGEPPAVRAADRDSTRSPFAVSVCELLRRAHGITREAERTRKHARAPTGDEPQRRAVCDPVDRLVEAPVAGEDEDGFSLSRPRELRRVALMLGLDDLRAEDLRDRGGALARDRARRGIDD